MNTRVPDSSSGATTTARINSHRAQLSILQERLATGRRINRPSDDPSGAEMVLNLRTSQKELEQFQSNAKAVSLRLTTADDALASYQTSLDRAKVLISRGLSEVSTPQTKEAVAIELESLRNSLLALANTVNNGEYVFGGTRQNIQPFDPATGIPAAGSTSPRYVQIEPGAPPVASGVTSDSVFGDATATIFQDLSTAIMALRGTGNAAADRTALLGTMSRMVIYSDQAAGAQAKIGASMNATDLAIENLSTNILSFDARANDIEAADFAETAVGIADAQRALDASLQVAAQGRRTLFDFLG